MHKEQQYSHTRPCRGKCQRTARSTKTPVREVLRARKVLSSNSNNNSELERAMLRCRRP